MFWRVRSVIVASALLGVLVSGPGSAAAAEWHPPVEGGIMLLGFGIPYPGGTHRGVDIAAESGAEVASPAAGTISFAGQVPADGGGTCTAITLELADGRKMSLLPLQGADVVAGEGVEAGQVLGLLASAGDDSAATPHLHVSLRSGDLYLDTGDLVAGAVAVTAGPPAAAPSAPLDLSGGTGGGTPAPRSVLTAPAAGSPAAAPTGSVQVSAAEPGVVAEPAAAVPLVVRKSEVAASGVPEASALVPAGWHGTARDIPVLAPIDARTMAGTGLACAMIAVAVGIGLSLRARPVHVN